MKNKLKSMIQSSQNIVFFGGAGVSTESGIRDFRGAQGLFRGNNQISPETILSHDFFIQHTDIFYDYYKKNLIYLDAKPNSAHQALSFLENENKLQGIITQNVDNLHQAAGSRQVLELHGSVKRNYCLDCHAFYDDIFIMNETGIPYCTHCNGIIKPDVVLYGESLDESIISEAIALLETADLLIIGGSSLSVHPAASLIDYYHGHQLVVINNNPTPQDYRATLLIRDNIATVLK